MNPEERELLLLFWSGELDEPENQRARELLQRSPEAQAYFEELKELEAAAASLADPPRRGIAGRSIDSFKVESGPRRRISVAHLIGIAAASAILVLAAAKLFVKPVRDPVRPETREEISVVADSKRKTGFEVFDVEPDSDVRIRLEAARERIRLLRSRMIKS